MYKIFSLFDKKAGAYMHPFNFHNKAQALRAVEDNMRDEKSAIARHPADYSLYCVGEWNETSGILTAYKTPDFIEEAVNFLN